MVAPSLPSLLHHPGGEWTEPSEPPGEEEHHSIFALPEEYDKNLLTWIIVALIGVTIVYERVTEYLEEKVFNEGIRAALWQKMLRELTILGFVSFSATITLQFVVLPEADHLIFEFAHVLMFTLAIMYAKEIAISSLLFAAIKSSFAAQDTEREDDLLAAERAWHQRFEKRRGTLGRLWAKYGCCNWRVSRSVAPPERQLPRSDERALLTGLRRSRALAAPAPSPLSRAPTPRLFPPPHADAPRLPSPRPAGCARRPNSRCSASTSWRARACSARRALSGPST